MPPIKRIKPDPGALGSVSVDVPQCRPPLIALTIEKDPYGPNSESESESECDLEADRKPVLKKPKKKKKKKEVNSRITQRKSRKGVLTIIDGPIRIDVVNEDESLASYISSSAENIILIRSSDILSVLDIRCGPLAAGDAFDMPGISDNKTGVSLKLNTEIESDLRESQVVALDGNLGGAIIRCYDRFGRNPRSLNYLGGEDEFFAHFEFQGDVKVVGCVDLPRKRR